MTALVLASTSPFRRELLSKVIADFHCAAPHVDETQLPGESARQLVERLAIAKAQALKADYPEHILIGSDQVAIIAGQDGDILGKPGNKTNAIAQLQRCNGQRVTFLTGLAVYHSGRDELQHLVEPFHVQFRQLSATEIEGYVSLEQPYNCAGSFKSEGLGISLFERLEGDDPNSLIGLPVIQLLTMLRKWGVNPLIAAPGD
ncbi:septum formation inhibitor Maf [Pseudidiomarina salinarum]|uniref:7-methyl-GTP pyrophosphatase n=1 Tax=Pseudidiomarina salinarum TaxID=435908 RepID=A0A094JGW5_9GAMM|nr:nucleoside triphosphate pyrophosphatase [Pseudidiomarina salinarum]KFZ31781.1 septum formation inhibitor Maf [Pseudidiomarina salinarum]RUO70447.1 septum formation inhibitor Maf [Pseudidiomarina salinarum]